MQLDQAGVAKSGESRAVSLATFFVRLKCDEACAEALRKRELEAAFGKRILFPEELLAIARSEPRFISEVEAKLRDFVLSGSRKLFEHLQPMPAYPVPLTFMTTSISLRSRRMRHMRVKVGDSSRFV